MKQTFSAAKPAIVLAIFIILTVQISFAQKISGKKLSKLDTALQAGFDSLKARRWKDAEARFEEAQKVFEKDKQPSEILFTMFTLPDENNSQPPASKEEGQIINFRHTFATRQALLQFLSFTYQLDGDAAQAQKYHDAVYATQGPLWGVSWRIFVPRFYRVFNEYIKDEKGENFGRYLYLAGVLMADAGDKAAFEVLQTAQQNAPKNADIAGLLANGFLQRKNPQEAKKQAELSLSIKPDQKSVLIDLATAECLLNDFDNSIRHAEAARQLDAEAPGPHLALAMNYLGKNDFSQALKEAVRATDLSGRNPFYLAVQAAVLEASGSEKPAEKLILEAYGKDLPSENDLNVWYLPEKVRQLVMKIVGRLSKPEVIG